MTKETKKLPGPPLPATFTLAELAPLHDRLTSGLKPEERELPIKPLIKPERGKFLSMQAGRIDLLASTTINKMRATLPFPLGRVKAGCGPIPLAPPGQLNLSVVVL